MEKNARYTFRLNSNVKDKFQMYCKIMNVSPSDFLSEVIEGFNVDAERIIKMRNVDELQEMFKEKVLSGQREIDSIRVRKEQQLDSGAEVLSNAGYECRE